ncbi:hypothetical protein B0O99DRAFT_514332 [Bisporella sp. PMI_857]|nr:hypothetical protein B0O99DRAFT_514332 [Bisporella sp. PMI_857]
MGNQLSQVFPPRAAFTEKDVPDLRGKVYIVTGANSGIGKELTRILYLKNAKVYLATRSEGKALTAIDEIKERTPDSKGDLIFLPLDLADLTTVKPAAEEFLRRESKLHVLFNNAGIMIPPKDSTTAQGHELQLGVNNIGHHMFTKLLSPVLISTAKTEPSGSVRIVWVSSSAGERSPQGGVPMDNLDYHKEEGQFAKYTISKAGNYLQATEFAKRLKNDGVVSVSLNPGNLDSNLWQYQGSLARMLIRTLILHPVINGAYTELFAGLSPQITIEKTAQWVVPWGRFMETRKDLVAASRSKAEGGTGIAEEFWDWNETQIKAFL